MSLITSEAVRRRSITYYEPDGISAYIRELNKGKETVHDIITYTGMSDGIEVTVAFQFVDLFEEKLLSYCNNIYNTDGGTHLTGFKTKFTQEINSYAKELGILKDPDTNLQDQIRAAV